MRKARLKKTFRCVLITLLALYMLCLLCCAVSVFRMQTLTYNSTAWGVVLAEYKLDFVHGFVEKNVYDFDGTLSAHAENTFSEEQQTKLRFVCAVSLMPLWRGRYNNPHVLDGDQWYTVIDYGGREKVTRGSNAYPVTYRLIYDTIMTIFE